MLYLYRLDKLMNHGGGMQDQNVAQTHNDQQNVSGQDLHTSVVTPQSPAASQPSTPAADYVTEPGYIMTSSGNDNGQPGTAPVVAPHDTDELLNLKQDVLEDLSPLVSHLDQTPEEKFRTTMMMIQATDNHALIRTAYEAAKNIKDEKARAQALLDIVNEINYFTQSQ